MDANKREKIIKVLEHCAALRGCGECPFVKEDNCGWVLVRDALALVKELTVELDAMRGSANSYKLHNEKLTEENERVRAQNEVLEIENKDFRYRIYELSRDNEEWEHENKDLECDNDMLRERITETRADTVQKMQERFKMYFGTYSLGYKIPLSEALKAVDQIAKELLN